MSDICHITKGFRFISSKNPQSLYTEFFRPCIYSLNNSTKWILIKTWNRLIGHGIWTRDLPNASLVCYHGDNSLGVSMFCLRKYSRITWFMDFVKILYKNNKKPRRQKISDLVYSLQATELHLPLPHLYDNVIVKIKEAFSRTLRSGFHLFDRIISSHRETIHSSPAISTKTNACFSIQGVSKLDRQTLGPDR